VKAKLGPVSSESRSIELSSGNQVTTVIAKAIVVATGLGTASCTNGEMEFSRTVSKNSRIGMETIIERPRSEIPRGKLLMAVGRFGYVGLTILPGERLHVAASVDPFSLQQRGPGELVADIIAQSGFSDFVDVDCKWRGTPPLTSRSKQIASERVFLVGDAAGYVEPFTGEGIRWALESGIGVIPMLQKSVANWRNSIAQEWSRWYTQNIQREQKVCRRIAVGLKQPMVRWFAHQAISLRPHFINEFISTIHSKDSS
jgi:flavin-dependent dehydrogenase